MTVQTTYEKNLANGLPGLIADIGNTNIDSFAAEVAIPFGVFVSRGTDLENQVIIGDAAAIGVSVRVAQENSYDPAGALGFEAGQYDITDTVGVLRSGEIWAQFDAVGGAVGDAVTITASGEVQVDGLGTALTGVSATIEKPAVDATIGTTSVFIGVIKVNG